MWFRGDDGTLQVAPPHDSPIIAAILPPDVVAMEALGELPDARLLPDEEGVVVRAVEKRRREFATGRQLACGRNCTRRCLTGWAMKRLSAGPEQA